MAGEEKQIVVEETTVVPGKMEFRLISPTESNFLKHIEWNKEELLAAVRSKVALYEGIVYTEETVKTAKNDRAELNNLVKAIDERRKKVKEVINQPYAEFEKELKEITDLIKKQSAEIDEQVKAFETAEKEEKRAKIMEAYEKAVGNLAEILPFSKVFDQRYLNKTCKLESAIADVQKKIEQVKTDLETIESVCGKYKLNATVIVITEKKLQLNITQAVEELGWEENEDELAMKIHFNMYNALYNKERLSSLVKINSVVVVKAYWGSGKGIVAMGNIVECERKVSKSDDVFNVVAYDNLFNLQKSSDNVYFASGKKTKSILTAIFKSWGITISKYTGPNVAHKKILLKNKKLGDIIREVLDEAKKKGGGAPVLPAYC